MRIEKYQIYSCLRITFCISVIAIWSTWLFIIPESKEQKAEVRRQKTRSKDRDIAHNVSAKAGSRKQETRIETLHATSQQKQEAKIETLHAMSQQKQEAQVLDIKSEMLNAQSSNQLKVNSQKLIVPKPQPPILNSQLSIINPKASPLPIAKSQKPIAVDTKPNKLNLDINLPNTASATRKILLATKHSNSSNSNEQSQANTSLRKQAHTEKNSFKVRDIADDLNSDISWVPKYLAEDTNLEQNKIRSIEIKSGEGFVLYSGGHSITFTKGTTAYEFKNGPFQSDRVNI